MDEDAIRLAILADHLDEVDYYALLEVPRDAGADAIRDGFHRFACRFHPDQHVDDPVRQRQALKVFKRGAEAYRVLMQPALRARYDAALAKGLVRLPAEAMQLPVHGAPRMDMPPGARPFYDKAVEALQRGDVGGARMHLQLARARGDCPLFDELDREIQQRVERDRRA